MNFGSANYFVEIGATVKISLKNGECATGVIMGYGLKKEETLHPSMNLAILPYDEIEESYSDIWTVWIENISELELVVI